MILAWNHAWGSAGRRIAEAAIDHTHLNGTLKGRLWYTTLHAVAARLYPFPKTEGWKKLFNL